MRKIQAFLVICGALFVANVAMADYGVKSIRISCAKNTDIIEVEPFIAWNDGNSRFTEFGAEEANAKHYLQVGENSFYAQKGSQKENHYGCKTNTRKILVTLIGRNLSLHEDANEIVKNIPLGNVWDIGSIYYLRSSKIGKWEECYNKYATDETAIDCRILEYPMNNDFAFIEAAGWGKDGVRRMLSKGANPNSMDTDGDTPLIVASYRSDVDAVRLLVEAGANVNVQDHFNKTPLTEAVHQGTEAIIKLLLSNGAKVNIPNRSILIEAISMGERLEIVKLLLERGAEVNGATMLTNSVFPRGTTPLMVAASRGYVGTVKLLLTYKADVNIENEKGETALTMANTREIANLLKQ